MQGCEEQVGCRGYFLSEFITIDTFTKPPSAASLLFEEIYVKLHTIYKGNAPSMITIRHQILV